MVVLILERGLSSRLRLVDSREAYRRLNSFLYRFSKMYSVRFVGRKKLSPYILYSTQSYLESDKLGFVLYSMLYQGYNAPVIVVRGYGGRLYIVDGHHRAMASLWTRRLVDSYLVEALGYKPRVYCRLVDTHVINPPVDPGEPYRTLKHMVNIIWFLGERHKARALVWRETIPIARLYATQPIPGYKTIQTTSQQWIPPLIYNYKNKYYVLDGHKRVCSLLLKGYDVVDSIVFTLGVKIGVIDTTARLENPVFDKNYCLQEENI